MNRFLDLFQHSFFTKYPHFWEHRTIALSIQEAEFVPVKEIPWSFSKNWNGV